MNKIGIGYEDYRRMIDDGCYYVDKTMLIRDIIEKGGMVTLFTRPRRFGKTLALSMLRTFFELEYDRSGNPVDKSRYFAGKKIMGAGDKILSMMGRYPVIKLSLKSAKQPDFRASILKLRDEIVAECDRHIYIKDSEKLTSAEAEMFGELLHPKKRDEIRDREDLGTEIERYSTAFKTLSVCLNRYHDEKVVILLDEYDVPLENAYFNGFYDEMVGFIRSLFESALKTNDVLEFAAITGCLRISRESIFTGLNHLTINSVRDRSFSEGFGFTEEETETMLKDYGIADRIPEVKEWYDGYLFGESEIYNPWSVIKYVDSIVNNGRQFPEPYWANTSSNQIIKDLVWQADDKMKRELDSLIAGGTIERKIHEEITYADIHDSEDNIWNFLFFTGYMKKISERRDGEDIYVTMKIPNREILSIYKNQVSGWFEMQMKDVDRKAFYKSVLDGNIAGMEDYVNDLLEKCISTFDSAESFYHGLFLSLLYGIQGYEPQSNREEGIGRPDIVLYPNRPRDPAILFELKIRKKFNEMEDGLHEAYEQIRERKYEDGILEDGYLGVRSYAVCFCKKTCIIGKMDAEQHNCKKICNNNAK